jgi:hypothetical protein
MDAGSDAIRNHLSVPLSHDHTLGRKSLPNGMTDGAYLTQGKAFVLVQVKLNLCTYTEIGRWEPLCLSCRPNRPPSLCIRAPLFDLERSNLGWSETPQPKIHCDYHPLFCHVTTLTVAALVADDGRGKGRRRRRRIWRVRWFLSKGPAARCPGG